MIIGIDASRANAEHRTGTEWYSFHVIQELKRLIPAEHEVVLYTKEPLRSDLAELPQHWSCKILRWPPRFLWTQLRLSIEMLIDTPDLLYIPAHTIPLIHPQKIALVVHDVGFERDTELYNDKSIGYSQPIAKKMINALVRLFTGGKYGATEKDYHRFAMDLAIKYATKMITVSEFSKSEMVDIYNLEPNRITVIPNGLNDLTTIASNEAETFSTFHIKKPYLLFVGRIEQKKNIPRLIDAFALLKKEYNFPGQLVLAGSPGYQYSEVQKRIKTHGLDNSVIQTGWTTEEELATLMQQATLFVFPSLYEGFGIPVLEAMRAGIPVICSDIPALKEVAADAAVYMNPRSHEDMAKQIADLYADSAKQQELQHAGYTRIERFSWKRTAQETWEVINSLV